MEAQEQGKRTPTPSTVRPNGVPPKRPELPGTLTDRLRDLFEGLRNTSPDAQWSERALEDAYRLAEEGYVHTQFRLGCHYHEIDPAKAAHYYRLAADQGHARSQWYLGMLYRDGLGVEKDDVISKDLYLLAANQGLSEAQHNLGVVYYHGTGVEKDISQSLKWYKKAADQGHPLSLCNLAFMYGRGDGVEVDKKKAVEYFQLAAQEWDGTALWSLGTLYQLGDGVEKDEVKGFQYIRLSAEVGNPEGAFRLGLLYYCGVEGVVEKDEDKALAWYEIAAGQGHIPALDSVCPIYMERGGDENTQKGLMWLRLGANEFADPGSQFRLANVYFNGLFGVQRDTREAAKYLRLAAEQGHPDSQLHLAYMYDVGEGVEADVEKSIQWYEAAADKGVAEALANLGHFYAIGKRGAVNSRKAAEYFNWSAERGSQAATDRMKQLYETGFGVAHDISKAEQLVTNIGCIIRLFKAG